MMIGPGQVLAEKYQLVSMLGQGGMGSVWRAEHLALRSPVAVKLIDSTLAENAEACARFMREAQSAAALRSPHVVQILDYGVDGGTPFIVMELMEGESLADRLERVKQLSPAEAAWILSDVCRAVGRAHQAGIVHRDLKPDNIYLVPNEEHEIAKVLDFGIAKGTMPGMTIGSGTRTGAMLGTPYYMSPEQVGGSRDVDFRSDLWALGIIAFECLTGIRPFVSDTLGGLVLAICTQELPTPSQMAVVPAGFDAWFARAAARHPNQRFQSAKELAQAFRVVCGIDDGPVRAEAQVSGGVGDVPPRAARQFLSTSVASTLTKTAAAEPRPASTAKLVVSGLALLCLIGGSSIAGWRWLSARSEVATATSGVAATSTIPATSVALPSESATRVAPQQEPSARSDYPAAEPSSIASASPGQAPRVMGLSRPPVAPRVTPRPPGGQTSSNPSAAGLPPTASPDPLGI